MADQNSIPTNGLPSSGRPFFSSPLDAYKNEITDSLRGGLSSNQTSSNEGLDLLTQRKSTPKTSSQPLQTPPKNTPTQRIVSQAVVPSDTIAKVSEVFDPATQIRSRVQAQKEKSPITQPKSEVLPDRPELSSTNALNALESGDAFIIKPKTSTQEAVEQPKAIEEEKTKSLRELEQKAQVITPAQQKVEGIGRSAQTSLDKINAAEEGLLPQMKQDLDSETSEDTKDTEGKSEDEEKRRVIRREFKFESGESSLKTPGPISTTPQSPQMASSSGGKQEQEEDDSFNFGSNASAARPPVAPPRPQERAEDQSQEEDANSGSQEADESQQEQEAQEQPQKKPGAGLLGGLWKAPKFLAKKALSKYKYLAIFVGILTIFMCFVVSSTVLTQNSALEQVVNDATGTAGATPLDFFDVFEVRPLTPDAFKSEGDPTIGNISAMTFFYRIKLKSNAEYNSFFGRTGANRVNLKKISLESLINNFPDNNEVKLTVTANNNALIQDAAVYQENNRRILWVPANVCSTEGCNTNLYEIGFTYTFDKPVSKDQIGSFQVGFTGEVTYAIGAGSDNTYKITPRYVICVNAKESSPGKTLTTICSEDFVPDGSGNDGGDDDPNTTLGKDFICPADYDPSAGDYIDRTQGFHADHQANDIVAVSNSGGVLKTNTIRAPVAGIVRYVEYEANLPYCGDAVIIQTCNQWNSETNPTSCTSLGQDSYYVGHFTTGTKPRFQEGQIVKQNAILGTYFNEFQNNCGDGCNKGVAGGLNGVKCWRGVHIHVEHRVGLCAGCGQSDITQIINNKCAPVK